jgi:hypothetical protein
MVGAVQDYYSRKYLDEASIWVEKVREGAGNPDYLLNTNDQLVLIEKIHQSLLQNEWRASLSFSNHLAKYYFPSDLILSLVQEVDLYPRHSSSSIKSIKQRATIGQPYSSIPSKSNLIIHKIITMHGNKANKFWTAAHDLGIEQY